MVSDPYPYRLGIIERSTNDHERRLNGINGSIDGMRADVDERMERFEEKLTSILIWAKVAFILSQILTPVIVGVVTYLVVR